MPVVNASDISRPLAVATVDEAVKGSDAASHAATAPAQPAGMRHTITTPRPEALPPGVQRFLRPLVGIDLATVPVQRGGQAQAAAEALGADALAASGQVVLGSADALTAPRTLGLLAHELTHVARRRMPRFIPPIARTPTERVGAGGPATTGPADEEALARVVEARVAAQAWMAGPAATPAAQPIGGVVPVQPASGGLVARPTVPQVSDRSASPAVVPVSAQAERWGGLPAPWEPLPAWLAAPMPGQTSTARGETIAAAVTNAPVPADHPAPRRPIQGGLGPGAGGASAAIPRPAPALGSERATRAPAPTPSVSRAVGLAPGPAPAPATAPAPVVHRAEHDRSPATVLPPPEPPSPAAPGPDLDALAQQVYAVLKRRLAVERRRLG